MDNDNNTIIDDDPVFYCRRCLSLSIKQMPFVENQDYCAECGSADIAVADNIEVWKEMYKKKYGHDYIIKRELKWPYWC